MCFCFVNIISSFQNSILIDWFPSKSIKVWRKIGWSSIPSKLVKVFDQRFLWPLSLSKFHQKLCQSFFLTKKTLIVTTGLKSGWHDIAEKTVKTSISHNWKSLTTNPRKSYCLVDLFSDMIKQLLFTWI
jgi:hypothetical protein